MYILVKQKVKRVKRFYIKKNHDTIFFNVIQYNKFFYIYIYIAATPFMTYHLLTPANSDTR